METQQAQPQQELTEPTQENGGRNAGRVVLITLIVILIALAALFATGKARLTTGKAEDFKKFFSYFDPVSSEPIALTVR